MTDLEQWKLWRPRDTQLLPRPQTPVILSRWILSTIMDAPTCVHVISCHPLKNTSLHRCKSEDNFSRTHIT